MEFIYEFDNQTYKLNKDNEQKIVDSIVEKYRVLHDARQRQIDETNTIRNEIYQRTSVVNTGKKNKNYKVFNLPELTELALSIKAHLYENIYKTPEAMFDCQGDDAASQANASAQKAMLVNYFTKMKFPVECEKMTDCIVDSGEAVFFVDWKKHVKRVRRKKTILEKIKDNILTSFSSIFGGDAVAQVEYEKLQNLQKNYVEYDQLIYEGPIVKCLDNLEFVFDPLKSDDLENADMIYRTYKTYDEIMSEKTYQVSAEARLGLKQHDKDSGYQRDEYQTKKDGDDTKDKNGFIEILEFYGNVKVGEKLIKNYLIVVADQKYIIRFEANPYIHKPFVYGNIIEDPDTHRGISLLRFAKSLNDISSEILSKQVYAMGLVVNPPWLTPKKMLGKNVEITEGAVIEYEADKLNQSPLKPERLDFSKAMIGFEFIGYFNSLIERVTGIFKNMVGAEEQKQKTATETQAVVAGQSARQNQMVDKIYSRLIVPVIEKVADTIANEKFGTEKIYQYDKTDNAGKDLEITDEVRNGNYRYIYSDCKTNAERTIRFKETLAMIKDFMQDPRIQAKVDVVELFRMALEQANFDNTSRIIYDDQEEVQSKIEDIDKNKVVQDYATKVFTGGNIGSDQGIVDNSGQMGVPDAVPQQ